MIHSNLIKQHKTIPDQQGDYRVYTIYSKDSNFIFECWDCRMTSSDTSSVGSRKAYIEFPDLKQVVEEYVKYVEAWERLNLG